MSVGGQVSILTPPLALFTYADTRDILENLDDEGRRLMAVADSVFTKVLGDLCSGAITVAQLELILQHEAQFLDLWKIRTHQFVNGLLGARADFWDIEMGVGTTGHHLGTCC